MDGLLPCFLASLQAIELKPIGGIHIMYKDRSLARLALGNYSGALEDAAQALALNPLYPEVPSLFYSFIN